ncbi:MAG: ribulose-phosphate 3-epimerase [Thermoleophilia bacterium]|nr:ribulose-phosphate 3-epimerase [Thermoleophilia bacterium]
MTVTPPTPVVLPSLMSADMANLGAQLEALMDAGARVFHIDVMDGHFVPNLTVGPDFTAAVARVVRPRGGVVDVHLMVERPGYLIDLFAPHADAISVHVEADPHVHRLLGEIRKRDVLAGAAINPGTPLTALEPLAGLIDYVNCMSVNPGFAGQSFIPTTPDRLRAIRRLVPGALLEIDGGVGPGNIAEARAAGADWLVSASSIFGSTDPIAAFRQLQGALG